MKAHPLAAIVMAAAMVAPSYLHGAGSRDDAVANLAAKQAEAQVLQAQLATWNKMKADATSSKAKAKEQYFSLLDRLKDADPGTVHLLRGDLMAAEIQIAKSEAHNQIADEQAAAINARLNQLEGEIAGARTTLQSFGPRSNEPAGGIKLTGSDYVPSSRPGEQPGMTTALPTWAKGGAEQNPPIQPLSTLNGQPTMPDGTPVIRPIPTWTGPAPFSDTTPWIRPLSTLNGKPTLPDNTPIVRPIPTWTGGANPWTPYLNSSPASAGTTCPPGGGNCPPGTKKH